VNRLTKPYVIKVSTKYTNYSRNGNGYIHRIYLVNRDFSHLADILLSDTDHCATYVHMCAVFTEVAGSHTSKATKRF
jgi:hypothetical protein